ncbi:unnamed protein product [Spirodela intermedia]|uniref:C2H2-type domain-containing protein n=1 Tax=Spirodela intermedia TaxID=51605 RepID=A0A7I8K5Z7_SPIIN|nr:unnamed protein product [Spirodela intermedia]
MEESNSARSTEAAAGGAPYGEEEAQKKAASKRKRNPPGMPDPDAEVVALSPEALMATNRFVCEICGKGFPRDQNLQLHRREHNLPWNLRGSGDKPRKRVYVCPVPTCVYHSPARALGDLTGVKKHFFRKHGGEKKHECEHCSKKYAVLSDWQAHMRACSGFPVFRRKHKEPCGESVKDSSELNSAAALACRQPCCSSNSKLRGDEVIFAMYIRCKCILMYNFF